MVTRQRSASSFRTKLILVLAAWVSLAGGLAVARPEEPSRIVRQTGHSAAVQVLTASTDGAFILSGDAAGTMKIWDTETDTAVAEYNFGGKVKIRAAAFHPLRPEIVALSISDIRNELPKVMLFDLTKGREIVAWQGSVADLAFSPDGRYLAAKNFAEVSLWDVNAGKLVVGLKGADGRGIGFRDKTTLVYRDEPGIRIMNVSDGSTQAVLPSKGGKDFAILADGHRLLDLRRDTVVLWDLDRGLPIAEPHAFPSNDLLAAAGDGSAAFAVRNAAYLGDTPHPVMMLSGANLTSVTGVSGLTSNAGALLYHDDVLYLGQGDGRIRRWRLEDNGNLSFSPDLGHWSPLVTALAISTDQRLIALGNGYGVVDVFDTISGIKRDYDPHGARPVAPDPNFGTTGTKGISQHFIVGGRKPGPPVVGLRFERNGYALWVTYRDGTVRIIEPISMTPIVENGPDERVRGRLALDAGGRIVAATEKSLLRWSSAGAAEKAFSLDGGNATYIDTAIDPISGIIVILYGHDLRAFAANGTPLPHSGGPAAYCVLPIGGNTFLAPTRKNALSRFNALSGEVVEEREISLGYVRQQACVTNGRHAAFGDSNGRIVLLELNGNGSITRTRIHDTNRGVMSLAWVDGVDLLAVGGANGTVDFIDPETGALRWRLTNLGRAGWIFDGPSGLFDAPHENWSDIVFTQRDDRLKPVSNGQTLLAALTPGLLELALKRPKEIGDTAVVMETPPSRAPGITFLEPAPTIEISGGTSGGGTMTFTDGGRSFEIPSIGIGEPEEAVTAYKKLPKEAPVLVRFRVTDSGSGIGACRLLRNRQVVQFFTPPQGSPAEIVLEARVHLRPGQSELSAFCFTLDSVPGVAKRMTVVTENAESPVGTAYIIAIGIDVYRNPDLKLTYAGADADLFGGAVHGALNNNGRYAAVVPLILKDGHATRTILSGVFDKLAGEMTPNAAAASASGIANIDRLQPATADDAVLVFFAGHGEMRDHSYRVLMHDYDSGTGNAAVLTDSDFRAYFGRLDATELVLVLDACHAGGALTSDGTGRVGPFNSKTFAQMAYDKGVFFLAAALKSQLAREETQFGHGLLTHALVTEGLHHGKADRAPADGTITVREFLEYPLTGLPALHAKLERLKSTGGEAADSGNGVSPFRNVAVLNEASGIVQTPKAYLPAFGFNDSFIIGRVKR
ncbi:MAG: hypothetical protein V7752_12710 [Halopseudomonas sp.]